jgi:alkanesulfonate monooxygenase SsuD/methylene tetrahydromethanopterin reductase-like flavin-dependent oxidoreductase (luciferase family)
MKIGISLTSMYPEGTPLDRQMDEQVELVRAARDNGFQAIQIGHHFLSAPHQFLQPLLVLARVAADAGEMTLMTSILLAVFYHPIDLAEQIATLDAIAHGRLIIGCGIGYRREEFDNFGIPIGERAGRLAEIFAIMKRLFTEEIVDFQGKYYRLSDARMTLKPVQKPHPPLWVGGGSEAAIRRAARIGDGIPLGGFVPLPELRRQIDVFQAERARVGLPPGAVSVRREVYLDADRERAWARAGKAIAGRASVYAGWGLNTSLLPTDSRTLEAAAPDPDKLPYVIGDSDAAARALRRYAEALRPDFLNVIVRWPGADVLQGVELIRLMGERVLPQLEDLMDRGGRGAAGG